MQSVLLPQPAWWWSILQIRYLTKLAPLGKREVGPDIHEGWKKPEEERIKELWVTYEVDHPLVETVTGHDHLCSSNRQFVAYLRVFMSHKMLKSATDFAKSLASRN